MSLPKEKTDAYIAILKEELLVAMGCTEPIAIAYAASILRSTLDCVPEAIRARLSGNIIKNVKSVIVPATGGLHGIEAAIAAGIIAACPERQLEVLSVLRHEDQGKIAVFLSKCKMQVEEMESPHTFDLELTAWSDTVLISIFSPGLKLSFCDTSFFPLKSTKFTFLITRIELVELRISKIAK